jgi:hypothetical protein
MVRLQKDANGNWIRVYTGRGKTGMSKADRTYINDNAGIIDIYETKTGGAKTEAALQDQIAEDAAAAAHARHTVVPRAVGALGVVGLVLTAVDFWNQLPQPHDPCAPWFPGDRPHCEVA